MTSTSSSAKSDVTSPASTPPNTTATTAITIPQLSAFSVSPTHGFLPPPSAPPLAAFPNPYYAPWDDLASSLSRLLSSDDPSVYRNRVLGLPLLTTAHLSTRAEWRRAFVVLGYLVHGFLWAGTLRNAEALPEPIVPPVLAEPYLAVCAELGMIETLSYAGLCLWNWVVEPKDAKNGDESDGLDDLDRLDCLVKFMEKRDEDVFLLVPVMVEAEGARVIPVLLDALRSAMENGDDGVPTVVSALRETKDVLRSVSGILRLIHQQCDPQVFYHEVRPYLAGGKGMEEKGMPRGVVFQQTNGKDVCRQWVGGSAAQSSLFQFIDLALGIEHKPVGIGQHGTLFEEMRSLMPSEHREFLKAVSAIPSLRIFVEEHSGDQDLTSAYNECLKELALWRSKHMGVVTSHIVTPSRKAQLPSSPKAVEEVTDGLSVRDESKLTGTGGSALIPTLKQAKQETLDAHVRG